MVARRSIRVLWLAVALVCAMVTDVPAFVNPFIIGGRAEYRVQFEQNPDPFAMNVAGNSAVDRTRVMLDVGTKDATYGALYLKGAALWDDTDPQSGQKAFRFEQGDYWWRQNRSSWQYGIRAFANQRRFFVYDMIAPVLDDDEIAGNDNIGVRFDADINSRGNATALFSAVGDDIEDARQLTYLKAGYAWQPLAVSASYLFENPGVQGARNRAVFKVELSSSYKRVSLIAAYQRTERMDGDFFFPGGSPDLDKFGDGLSAVLSPGAAFHAELRINPIHVPDGRLWFVWRYDLTGEAYAAEFARLSAPARVVNTPALYYRARGVNLNARVLYRRSVRYGFESEQRDTGDAAVWATLRNGTDVLMRARVNDIENDFIADDDQNFVHLGARYTKRRLQSGIHLMWKDIGTVFSGRRVAWDGTVSVAANWRFYWRVLVDDAVGIGEQAFVRLEFRPSNRLYFVSSYGREYIGDGPFLLEDRDVGLSRANDALYRLSLRGDF